MRGPQVKLLRLVISFCGGATTIGMYTPYTSVRAGILTDFPNGPTPGNVIAEFEVNALVTKSFSEQLIDGGCALTHHSP